MANLINKYILNKCKKCKYVSFDLYDTLILRDVSRPEDVFTITDCVYKGRYDDSGIGDFLKKRVLAEVRARENKNREITIDDIYDIFEIEGYDQLICKRYCDIEKWVEEHISHTNIGVKKIYDWCIANNKKVYIITDMYLPIETIKLILDKNGITGYEKVYLSSVYGSTKHGGGVYEAVSRENNLAGKEWLHIGDNLKSDIFRARTKGISTVYIKKRKSRTLIPVSQMISQQITDILKGKANQLANEYAREYSITENYLINYLNNIGYKKHDVAEFGYSVFGPLMYGFASWLCEQFHCNKIDGILFFSREGYFIKKIYEKINAGNEMPTYYFHVSRKALQVPAIWIKPQYEEVINSMFFSNKFTVKWLLEQWGVCSENTYKKISPLGVGKETEFEKYDVANNKQIKAIYECLKEDIVNNSKTQYENFLHYLLQFNLSGNIAIVDIGWNGNMQKAFEKIIACADLDIKVKGFYLGYHSISGNHLNQKMYGYIHNGSDQSCDFLIDYYIEPSIEVFTIAPHGTTAGYTSDYKPIIVKSEYEGTLTEHISGTIQRNAIQFIEDYNVIGKYLPNICAIYMKRILCYYKKPTTKQVGQIGNIQVYDENFYTIAKPDDLKTYIWNLKLLKDDFERSTWKIGFLKRLIKIPLPYFRAVKILRNIFIQKKNFDYSKCSKKKITKRQKEDVG